MIVRRRPEARYYPTKKATARTGIGPLLEVSPPPPLFHRLLRKVVLLTDAHVRSTAGPWACEREGRCGRRLALKVLAQSILRVHYPAM
jgi:hypothetical protein